MGRQQENKKLVRSDGIDSPDWISIYNYQNDKKDNKFVKRVIMWL